MTFTSKFQEERNFLSAGGLFTISVTAAMRCNDDDDDDDGDVDVDNDSDDGCGVVIEGNGKDR